MHNYWVLLLVMAVTTYLIRSLPFAAFRFRIKSRFVRDFLYYVPYAVLGAMTVPYIFYATGNVYTAVVGFVVAFSLAYMKFSLLTVAALSCLAAYLIGFIF